MSLKKRGKSVDRKWCCKPGADFHSEEEEKRSPAVFAVEAPKCLENHLFWFKPAGSTSIDCAWDMDRICRL